MTTYAIGDIQGCYEPFMRLLDKIDFDDKKDKLWSVGDLVNRGPDSLKVLEFCRSLGKNFVCSLGNHDLHLLAVAACRRQVKTGDTFDDVLTSPNRDELLHWLRHQKLLHYDKDRNVAVVHAGIAPQWSMAQACKLASEVEDVIRDDNLAHIYYHNMYGNTPAKWSEELSGPVRWRVITNYLTRMRFCNHKGKLELQTKTGMLNPPKGYMPWFLVPDRKASDTSILFGHWAALLGETFEGENVYALDTGCVWGQKLAAINIDKLDKMHTVKAKKKSTP
ncbi:MAG: symmetrical bis(5'-nucleosyl)-tetraphosphatase [Pseudomonadales bacterium]